MATVSTWNLNDVSTAGINTAQQNSGISQYGTTIAGPYTSYQAAFNAQAGIRTANPKANVQIVRTDVVDGGSVQYSLQTSI